MKQIIFAYTFILFGLISCSDNYVEYKPHYLSGNNEHKYYGEPELDSIEFKNTIQVLDFYLIDYKTKNDNTILISKKANADWSLLWNFTLKANDNEWLNTHKAESKIEN